MRVCYCFRSGTRILGTIRSFCDDPAKTFRQKGLSEENRYFLKKQEEELRRLRKELQVLAKFQAKLDLKLEESQKALKAYISKEEQTKK